MRTNQKLKVVRVDDGDQVTVDVIGSLPGGTTIRFGNNGKPFEFIVGAGEVFPGLDKEVIGMGLGETKVARLPASECFGDYDDRKVFSIKRPARPDDVPLRIGEQIEVLDENGESTWAAIRQISTDSLVVDGNHPLCGKDLVLEIKLQNIGDH